MTTLFEKAAALPSDTSLLYVATDLMALKQFASLLPDRLIVPAG